MSSASTNKLQLIAYLEEFRVRDPPKYREWYFNFKEHLKNPTRIPMPSVPGCLQPRSPQENPTGNSFGILYKHLFCNSIQAL
jgi:hypothetical protein